ncbi:MAG TPA: serine hydrolase domain-containing protein [Kofleriaceae bacterium]
MLLRVAIVLALFGCKDKAKEKPASTKPPGDAAVKRTLDEELEAIRSKNKLPALAAVAWHDGKLVEIAAVGLRKADDATSKVTTKDLWHLGSNTKAMTATVIGIYVDRGALKFDDTLAKWFKKIDPGYAKITLDQLLRHEGGAPGEPPDELWKQLWADGDKPEARTKFVEGILAKPPEKPGTFVYSNAGYVIAGVILEKASKKRWEDVMREELFAKLDMKTCGFGAPGRKDVVDQPRGHDAGGTAMAPGPAADNPPGLGPAGTVHCSLEDYGKFLAMHSSGQPALVTPETMQHLHTARDGGYAGGWLVLPHPRGKVLAHSGSNTMWFVTTMLALTPKPDDRWTLVMATNSGSFPLDNVIGLLADRFTAPKK